MRIKYIIISILFVAAAGFVLSGCTTETKTNTNTTANIGTGDVTGNLDIKGSDTLLQLVSSMAEAFTDINPDAEVTVTGGGSGTGIAALLNGEVDMANASRDVKSSEEETATEAGMGIYKFIVARDGLSIIVSPDNPVEELTVEQVGKIYKGEITNWSEVGGNDVDITLYGRQSTSGTYEFMKDEVLEGDYASTMLNLEGNQAIVDAVVDDENDSGVGYVGIGYAVEAGDTVKILNIASAEGGTYYEPTDASNIASGDYPITRPLYQVFSAVPEKDGIAHELLKFEMSDAGIDIVEEVDFYEPNVADQEANQTLLDMIEG